MIASPVDNTETFPNHGSHWTSRCDKSLTAMMGCVESPLLKASKGQPADKDSPATV